MSDISPSLLPLLNQWVTTNMGLYFPSKQRSSFTNKIKGAAREFGYSDVNSFIKWLLSSPLSSRQIEILAEALTIGETYFFREPKSFQAFEDEIIPALVRKRDEPIRIWSAGCCTGEEAYSIAIILFQNYSHKRNLSIIGTDINEHFLTIARAGVYQGKSFRTLCPEIRKRYFKESPQGSAIIPKIKKMVEFSWLNLATATYPSLAKKICDVDVIFCRNVLMYFSPENAKRVINRYFQTLKEGGWLLVGSHEAILLKDSPFTVRHATGTILYRKEIRKSANLTVFSDDRPPSEKTLAKMTTDHSEDRVKLLHRRMDYLETFAELSSLALRIANLIAKCCANQGDLETALQWCEKAIAIDDIDPSLHYLRATILQEQEQLCKAIEAFKNVIDLDSTFIMAHFVLGNLLRQQGSLRQAYKCFTNALSLLEPFGCKDIVPQSNLSTEQLREVIESILDQLSEKISGKKVDV